MSNLGLSDWMFISAIFSFVEFHEVLSDLFSGLSRLWCISLLLSHILCFARPPLFLLKFHFNLRFFILLHTSVLILVVCALCFKLSRSALEYFTLVSSLWNLAF